MAVHRSVRIGAIVAGEQPDAADLESLRGQGIRSVVNLRLSTEASFGLTPSRESRLAEELGLAYAHLPVSAELLSDADVQAFHEIVAKLPGPIYVHCGLGQRAAALAVLVDGERSAALADTIADAERYGIVFSPRVRDFIKANLERQKAAQQQDEVLFARVVR